MSVKEEFGAWYPLDDETRRRLATEGLIVLDTNVLLALYRMNSLARQDMLSLLEAIGDRLWIPNQVGLEFHRNRLGVIYDQEQALSKLQASVTEVDSTLRAAAKVIREHPTFSADNFNDVVTTGMAPINEYLRAVGTELSISLKTALDNDPILASITELYTGRVGPPFPADRQTEVDREAKRRVDNKIPPGYADAKKPDGRSSGDFYVWRQLLDEATSRDRPVLFITNDQKEDWYRRLHGITVGPRVELIVEMQQEAGKQFHAQTLVRFLQVTASLLKPEIESNTLQEANRLDEIDRAQLATSDFRDASPKQSAETNYADNREALAARKVDLLARVAELQADWNRIPAEERSSADPRSYARALETRLSTSRHLLNEVEAMMEKTVA